MTNAVNVEFIVEKLLAFLSTATDYHFRTDLVGQITQCAERFAPSNAWYVQTIIRVFELAGDKVKASVAQTLTQLIAEGSEAADEEEIPEGELSPDDELRTEAVENFLDLMQRPKLPEILAQAVAWVLGEYGYLATSCSLEGIMERLCNLTLQCTDPLTKAHVVSAISKLVAQNGGCPNKVYTFMERYCRSVSLDVQQRCVEFKLLLKDATTLVEVLPVDASCEDIEVDEELSFLNDYVQAALQQGAKPYTPPQHYDEDDGDNDSQKTKLKITPYAVPTLPVAVTNGMVTGPGLGGNPLVPLGAGSVPGASGPLPGAPALAPLTAQTIATAQGNQLIGAAKGVNQVWGRKPEPPPPAPAPTPAPVAAAPASPMHASVASSSGYSTPSASSGPFGPGGAVSTSSGATGSYPVEPPAPRELTEKEKQAAALFGGLGAGSAGGRAAKPAQRRSTTGAGVGAAGGRTTSASSVASPAPAAAPEPIVEVSPPPAAVTPAPAPVPAQVVSPAPPVVPELLDLDLLSEQVAVAPTITAAPIPPTPAPLMPAAATPAVPPAAPAPAPKPVPATNAISDAFAGLFVDPSAPAASVDFRLLFEIAPMPQSGLMP